MSASVLSRAQRRRRVWSWALAGVAAVGAAGLWPDGPRGPVDWRAARVVALQSDDWGLCGFLPAAEALREEERALLQAGRFPPAYWNSTLEDSAEVAALAGGFIFLRNPAWATMVAAAFTERSSRRRR